MRGSVGEQSQISQLGLSPFPSLVSNRHWQSIMTTITHLELRLMDLGLDLDQLDQELLVVDEHPSS